jgi:hypothetical protein
MRVVMNGILKSLLPPLDLGWNHVRARCGLPTCHNKLLMRPVPRQGTGIQVGQNWYCSADCFATAARIPLETLAKARITEPPSHPRLSLGLVMLAKGYLTEDQLRSAMDRSERRGEDLETALKKLGLATDKQLAGARGAQWGRPVLADECAAQPVVADIPRTFLREFQAVPLHYSLQSKRLVMGFVQKVEHSLLGSIEEMTGCRAEACLLTPAEYEAQMERVTFSPDYEEVVVEKPGTPAQMAKTLGGIAVEVTASAASFVQCRSWVWARVMGKRRTIDVLFARTEAAPVVVNRAEVLEFRPAVVAPLG